MYESAVAKSWQKSPQKVTHNNFSCLVFSLSNRTIVSLLTSESNIYIFKVYRRIAHSTNSSAVMVSFSSNWSVFFRGEHHIKYFVLNVSKDFFLSLSTALLLPLLPF